jgi:hypothetical protein
MQKHSLHEHEITTIFLSLKEEGNKTCSSGSNPHVYWVKPIYPLEYIIYKSTAHPHQTIIYPQLLMNHLPRWRNLSPHYSVF